MTHTVFLSGVLRDVIGVTSNCRVQTVLYPIALCMYFLRQKTGDDFMIHPVDLRLHTIFTPTKFVVRRPRPKFNDELAKKLCSRSLKTCGNNFSFSFYRMSPQ